MDVTRGPSQASHSAAQKASLAFSHLHARTHSLLAEAAVDARSRDRVTREGGWEGPLHGVMISVKDTMDVAGAPTSIGLHPSLSTVADSDSTLVTLLRRAGGVLVGKDNLPELCLSTTTKNDHYGHCANPWNPERVPGGSSGGSGVAVATGMSQIAIGTDAGGSVRIPASICGVVGIRPTAGRISHRETRSTAPQSNHVTSGPLARRVVDAARCIEALDRYDKTDVSSLPGPRKSVISQMNDGVEGLRIGIPRSFFFDEVDPQIRTLVLATAKVWEGAGAEIVEISIPEAERTQQMLLRMVLANRALLYGNILDTTPELLSPSTRKRLAVGRSVSGVEYAEAEDFRGRWNHILQGVFESVDLFLSPTVAVATPARDSSSHVTARGDLTRLTCAQSLAGIPSMSLPCGFRADGMPVGAQLSAGWWNDDLLVRAGVVYQAQTNWHLRLPPGVDEPVFL